MEATLEALERHGPDASLEQIARIAGMPKPKIYRHFDDKADLIGAVGERLRDLILERLAEELKPDSTVRDHVRRSLTAVLGLIAEHPNAIRMLSRSNALAVGGRDIARTLIAFTAKDFSRAQLPTDGIEPLTHALVGSVLGTADWWLLQPEEERMPLEQLVAQLTVVMIGAGDAALRTIGRSLDPDAVVGAEHLLPKDPTPAR